MAEEERKREEYESAVEQTVDDFKVLWVCGWEPLLVKGTLALVTTPVRESLRQEVRISRTDFGGALERVRRLDLSESGRSVLRDARERFEKKWLPYEEGDDDE